MRVEITMKIKTQKVDSRKIEIPIYNDVWMDNGLETLYRILKEAEDGNFEIIFDKDSIAISAKNFAKFKESVGVALKNRRLNLVVLQEDKKLGGTKEVKKDYILIQEETKIKGKVAFKEDLFNEKSVLNATGEVLDAAIKEGTKTCVLCGRSFSKSVKKLQQAAYPFVTKIKSLSGVRSYKNGEVYSLKEYFEDFCPICYLVGIVEWSDDGIIYRTDPGEKSTLLLPFFNSLEELSKFKKLYRPLLDKSSRYRNIRVKIGSDKTETPPGAFSTLLCFYEKFFFDITKRDVVGKSWVVMEVPFGPVKNIKSDFIDLDDSVLQVIKDASEAKEPMRLYKEIIEKMYFFYDNPKGAPVNWQLTGEIRENLSKAFLEDDFHSFTRSLLPRKGGRVGYSKDVRLNIEELIYIWRWKHMGIPKERLDAIKSVGNIVAKASRNNPSLLYKLDKTRTIDELWSVLREISRKLIGFKDEDKKMIKPTALDEIIQLIKDHEDKWKEIRDLLVVYSSMYYSIRERKEVG
jgi:hypothetical protein